MDYTRRDLGKFALLSLPLAKAFGASMIDSKIDGVQVGAITYSFNTIAAEPQKIIDAYVSIGLGEAELMSNHCESLAGAPAMPNFGRGGRGGATRANVQVEMRPPATNPPAGQPPAAGTPPTPPRGGGRMQLTPEQQEEMTAAREKLAKWRTDTGPSTWKAVRQKFNDAGIQVALLCYNMQDSMKDEDIEYGFTMAEGLGVKAMSTSTTLTMAKRIPALSPTSTRSWSAITGTIRPTIPTRPPLSRATTP